MLYNECTEELHRRDPTDIEQLGSTIATASPHLPHSASQCRCGVASDEALPDS